MTKTYRITSEVVNFSLVTPDDTPFEEAVEEAKEVFLSIKERHLQVLQNPCRARIALVNEEEEEEDGQASLARLVADYYQAIG